MRRLLLIVAVLMLMLLPGVASAGGGGGIMSACPGFASGTTISMLDSCFDGTAHHAPAGSVLTISNDGELPHSYTSVDGSFTTGELQSGETYQLTIDEPGVFEVFCSLHGTADGQGMAGVLMIGEALPPPVGAELDLTAVRQAVVEENQALMETVERQNTTIGNLSGAVASLRDGLDEIESAEPSSQEPMTIGPIEVESPDTGSWLPLIGGVAVGLATAALLVALLSGRRKIPEEAEGQNRARSATA